MQNDRCLFITKGKRCTNKQDLLSPFCSEHKGYFAKIDNKTLLEMTAKGARECIYVADNKKISFKMDDEMWGNFTNCLNELSARGYKYEEAGGSIGRIIKEKELFADIEKELGKDPKWKKFEKIIAGIHMLKAEGAKVKFDDHTLGKRTGRERQIDVSLRFSHGYYEYMVIIECKDLKTRVPIGSVEAFCKKVEDVGAHKGVMVSPIGFQKGAIETAKAYDVDLFTLTEEMGDWTKTIREYVIKVPYPIDIEFDHPTVDKPPGPTTEKPIKFADVVFYKDEKSPPITLLKIVTDVCHWAYEKNIALPCIVNVKLEKEFLTEFPGTDFYTPIYGIKIRLEHYEFRSSHKVDIPPKLVNYIYSDIDLKHKYKIPAEEVPMGVDTTLEPGKFYTNRLGMKYRCNRVEGDKATMMLLDSHQHGIRIDVEFVQDIKYAFHYLPINNPKETERLEKRYQFLKRKRKGKKSVT